MSDGLEIPGEVLAQAVVAQAVAKGLTGAPDAHAAHHATNCANCGAVLGGRYCQQCGQAAHVHRSLLHMVEELLHGIFHFETKAWRTLPLLMLRPGRLTREYIDGRRVRYVGPLPLFLFMMFAMFLVISLTSHRDDDAAAAARKTPDTQARVDARPAPAAPPAASAPEGDDDIDLSFVAGKHKAPLTEARLHGQLLDNGMTWLAGPGIEHKLVHAYNNRELTVYKLKNGAAKYAILLVPITLPFLWLLFVWRRGVNMFDHAVFSFYSLSAMAVLVSLTAILGTLNLGGAAGALICFAPPIHLFVQLRGAYALSRWGALWRTLALLVYALVALALYFLIVVLVSM